MSSVVQRVDVVTATTTIEFTTLIVAVLHVSFSLQHLCALRFNVIVYTSVMK